MIPSEDFEKVKSQLPSYFSPDLVQYIAKKGSAMKIPANTEIVSED